MKKQFIAATAALLAGFLGGCPAKTQDLRTFDFVGNSNADFCTLSFMTIEKNVVNLTIDLALIGWKGTKDQPALVKRQVRLERFAVRGIEFPTQINRTKYPVLGRISAKDSGQILVYVYDGTATFFAGQLVKIKGKPIAPLEYVFVGFNTEQSRLESGLKETGWLITGIPLEFNEAQVMKFNQQGIAALTNHLQPASLDEDIWVTRNLVLAGKIELHSVLAFQKPCHVKVMRVRHE